MIPLTITTSAKNQYHLTDHQRDCIMDDFVRGLSIQEIFNQWEVNIHHRSSPSIKTLYELRKEWKLHDNVDRKKKGPKRRSVLTQEKLVEIEDVIYNNRYITGDSLSLIVDLPRKTCLNGVKILGLKKYEAIESPWLTELHCHQRFNFCKAFRCWNEDQQMSIWWSDESVFKVEELFNYNHQTYYASENLHLRNVKPKRQKSINILAAIRGDEKVLFKILEWIQTSKQYKKMLKELFPEMESEKSFFMQDGAGHHTGGKGIRYLNKYWKDRWIGKQPPRLEFPP